MTGGQAVKTNWDKALEPAIEPTLEPTLELWQNRLVCGNRAVMVAPVRQFPMTALPALKSTPPRSIHAR
jgi:hypothetical protein